MLDRENQQERMLRRGALPARATAASRPVRSRTLWASLVTKGNARKSKPCRSKKSLSWRTTPSSAANLGKLPPAAKSWIVSPPAPHAGPRRAIYLSKDNFRPDLHGHAVCRTAESIDFAQGTCKDAPRKRPLAVGNDGFWFRGIRSGLHEERLALTTLDQAVLGPSRIAGDAAEGAKNSHNLLKVNHFLSQGVGWMMRRI